MAILRQAAPGAREHAGEGPPTVKAAPRAEGRQTMVTRLTGAILRALLMVLLIATPYILLPDVTSDTAQVVVLIALFAAVFTFVEYNSTYPSLVEFRDAPPFNRLRFFGLYATVFALSVLIRAEDGQTMLGQLIESLGTQLGDALDFPFSPVRLVTLMMPAQADPALIDLLRTTAGFSYLASLVMLLVFVLTLRLRGWPARGGAAFNVWVNLPTFDPTGGGDVVDRLNRDAQVNLVLGFLLPFIIPAFVKLASDLFDPVSLADPFTMIWTITAWAFLPASLLMRGIALGRVAQMICDQRRSWTEEKALRTA